MTIFVIVDQFENEEEFGCDAYGYYILLNGEKIAEYGDDYHDDGRAKCQGFIDGFVFVKGKSINKYEIKYEERADWQK